MILAAGEGRRMRPLTAHTPKPLLNVGGKPLIAWHIERLVAAGFQDLVVNAAYLGDQIADFCGDGSRWGVRIQMSIESVPLETAGGIIKALPLLGDAPFAVINADVFTDFPFARLQHIQPPQQGGHLVMVTNPEHNPGGDFTLRQNKLLQKQVACEAALTYSGIGVFDPGFFRSPSELHGVGVEAGGVKLALRPLLDSGISADLLSAERWDGRWFDIGTPARLAQLDVLLSREASR